MWGTCGRTWIRYWKSSPAIGFDRRLGLIGAATPGELVQTVGIQLARPAALVRAASACGRLLRARRACHDPQSVAVVRAALAGECVDAEKVLAGVGETVNEDGVGGLAEDPYGL